MYKNAIEDFLEIVITLSNMCSYLCKVSCLRRVRDCGSPGRVVCDRGYPGNSGMRHGREAAYSLLPVPHATSTWIRCGREIGRASTTPIRVLWPRSDGRPLRFVRRPRRRFRLRKLDMRRENPWLFRIRRSEHDRPVAETRRYILHYYILTIRTEKNQEE